MDGIEPGVPRTEEPEGSDCPPPGRWVSPINDTKEAPRFDTRDECELYLSELFDDLGDGLHCSCDAND
jgi:hypothetical protein